MSERFEGLWISPEGEKFPVTEHLVAIQRHPHLFGLSAWDVNGQSIEGLRLVALRLLADGWVRYRHFGPDLHMFETESTDRRVIDELLTAAEALPDDRIVVHVRTPRGEFRGVVRDWTARTIAKGEPSREDGWRFSE
jgi:hypothetical protein